MNRNRSIGMVLVVAGGALALIIALIGYRGDGLGTMEIVAVVIGILAAIVGAVMLFRAPG
jgi:hypothetical protein